jgi:hypothetical protein
MSKDIENTKRKRNNNSENQAMSNRGAKTIRIFLSLLIWHWLMTMMAIVNIFWIIINFIQRSFLWDLN